MTEHRASRTTRNITDAAAQLRHDNPEAGLVAPLYENIDPPEDFGPVEVVVDDLKIKRFAFTQDDYDAWFMEAGPEGHRIGHAALLINDMLQMFTMRYAPSQVVGLHTQEELWFERPVPLGSTVALSARYTEKFELRGQGYVVMTAEVRDEQGRICVRHRGEEIMRTAPAEVGGRGSADTGRSERINPVYDTELPLAVSIRDEVRAGTGLIPLVKETTLEQVAVFSRYGEGIVNIHNNLEAARRSGLPVPIVQGQQLACYLVELLTRVFGSHWFTGGWIKTKFLRPVDVFDTVSVEGVFRELTTTPEGREARLELWVRRGDRTIAAVAWASCRFPGETDERHVPYFSGGRTS